jgi:hypothetical protein
MMPRYFFDVHNGGRYRDDIGTELSDLMKVRKEAMQLLPNLARDDVPEDGDHRIFTVLVTDEDGRATYSGTLSYTGLWLLR